MGEKETAVTKVSVITIFCYLIRRNNVKSSFMDFGYSTSCRNSNVEPPNCSWYCDCRIVNPVVFEEMS